MNQANFTLFLATKLMEINTIYYEICAEWLKFFSNQKEDRPFSIDDNMEAAGLFP